MKIKTVPTKVFERLKGITNLILPVGEITNPIDHQDPHLISQWIVGVLFFIFK